MVVVSGMVVAVVGYRRSTKSVDARIHGCVGDEEKGVSVWAKQLGNDRVLGNVEVDPEQR